MFFIKINLMILMISDDYQKCEFMCHSLYHYQNKIRDAYLMNYYITSYYMVFHL